MRYLPFRKVSTALQKRSETRRRAWETLRIRLAGNRLSMKWNVLHSRPNKKKRVVTHKTQSTDRELHPAHHKGLTRYQKLLSHPRRWNHGVQQDYQMIRTPLSAFKTTIAHARFSKVQLRPNNSFQTLGELTVSEWVG